MARVAHRFSGALSLAFPIRPFAERSPPFSARRLCGPGERELKGPGAKRQIDPPFISHLCVLRLATTLLLLFLTTGY
jgi:hypothetical protein